MHLGVCRGACLPRELLTVTTFNDGGGSGKMFDFLECRLTISRSLALGPVLRVAPRDFSIDSSSSLVTIIVAARLRAAR